MEHGMTRRDMMRASALLAGCVCGCRTAGDPAAPRSTCCATPDLEPESLTIGEDCLTVDLRKARSLSGVGNAAWIADEGRSLKLIIVHADPDEYSVLSGLCTHGGQTISYNRHRRLLQCNNFNHSNFDLSGRVVKGPAETPLASYPVRVAGETLVVMLKEATT
jgi:Rieske Fe-S protein